MSDSAVIEYAAQPIKPSKPNTMKSTLTFFALTILTVTSLSADYPEQPIKIIVPTAAGGGHDTMARIFQRTIQEESILSEKMVIVNIPGAGGAVGTRKIKDSPNDGYTIGIWNPNALISAKLMGITNYDHNDYEIIAMTGYTELGMGVKADSSIESVADLIKQAQANPGSMKLATEIGTATHIIPMILGDEADFEFRIVNSGGGSKRLASILGGHTDISIFSSQALINFSEAGIRPLLLFSDSRSPLLPDTPTAKESGINIVLNESRIWLAPKETPPERLEVLRQALKSAIESPEAQKQMESLGISPVYGDSAAVLADIERMRGLSEPVVAKMRR